MDLGFDYCLKEECQRRCLRPVQLASVGVNKAADYIMKAEEVVRPLVPVGPASIDDGEGSGPRTRAASSTAAARPRTKSTLERLREYEGLLDAALARIYDRFCRGEITAKDMDSERRGLIRAFNNRVMSENIRYRSMLRRLP